MTPRRANAGKGVERLEMKFGVNNYGTQFTSTGKKKRPRIQTQHEPNSRGHDITTNDRQEMNKYERQTIKISYVQRLHTTI